MKAWMGFALGLLVCGFVTWTIPVQLKNQDLKARIDNLTADGIFVKQRYNGLLLEAQNLSDTVERVQAAGQYYYAQASEMYAKWQADRVVAWTLLSLTRDAVNATDATNATSEYISIVVPRWHVQELEAYIADRNLSYDDMEGG